MQIRLKYRHEWLTSHIEMKIYAKLDWNQPVVSNRIIQLLVCGKPLEVRDKKLSRQYAMGWQYVSSYKGLNCQLLECFVDPSEIGAICDIHNGSDGAIRVKEYFIYGAVAGRTKGIYHSSTYAKMKDEEWKAYKLAAVKEANELLSVIQTSLDNLGL